MEDNIFDKVHEVDLKKTMEESYIDYAMSVIASRALPDVRDGLKPVQRRVLFSMIELNNGPDKPHRKCARIVGDTMGKYHPHGDSSIYGALVNMAQDWSTRYPLVDGHGNFGSVDGDGAAAMRYTEARLSKISMEMLADINKNTVDFAPNFDETEKEPTVLPARYPNLLVNGTSGIAVGMATNIPPHNLKEIIAAVVKIIDNIVEENRDTEIEEILKIVKGPDFPTGATILGTRGIEEAYRTGRGKIRVRAVSNIETLPNGKSQIIVTELPYLVNKARLIEKIADLVKEKKIDGITALNDHSSREGMRICIELRRDVNANVLLNKLYKHTQLQDTFGVIMLALVNNQPKVMNLMEILKHYLAHQEEVVTRRTQYDLNKARERAHILEGLLKALDNIDEVIRIIRGSENTQVAKARLMERFELSDAQAQAIVDMRLRTLTGLEREKLEAEYKELMARIRRLEAILADRNLLLRVIREEILAISEKYGDERKTAIGFDEFDISMEDMIPNENTVITMTKLGYIKRMTVDNFRSQNRGGKGIKGMQTIEDDYIDELLMEEAPAKLESQLEHMDWSYLDMINNKEQQRGTFSPLAAMELSEIEVNKDKYLATGIDAVKNGKVGAILLAGGQGTRLGFDKAKGMFNIGKTKELYIFEQLVANLMKVTNQTGTWVPLYVMTSEINDGMTREFFEEHDYFGYNKDYVKFFVQEMVPAVDFDGNLLMKSEDSLAMSPNGNGGWFKSLINAGLDKDLKDKGVEWLNVFAVDNVLQQIADPVFVGATIESGCVSGSKVVRKCDPYERVGAMCLENGKPSIVEYYELTPEMAEAKNENGSLQYGFGVILNYLFRVDKLMAIAEKSLPLHVVEKKVPYIDENGTEHKPETPNAYKFETLILDMVYMMDNSLPFEVDREKEFAPVKNATGTDSVETARALLEKNGIEI